jgi:hypothetical protein
VVLQELTESFGWVEHCLMTRDRQWLKPGWICGFRQG